METTPTHQNDGIKLVQLCGGVVEIYFDWDVIPEIDLSKEYYVLHLKPDSPLLAEEWARPNSAGPLNFNLVETVQYRIDLLKVPYFDFNVRSDTIPAPWIELVPQHENLLKLVWRNSDFMHLGTDTDINIVTDGENYRTFSFKEEPACDIEGRPKEVRLISTTGENLATVVTNYAKKEVAGSLSVHLEKSPTRLFYCKSISSSGGWRIRAELTPSFQMRHLWRRFFQKRYPESDGSNIIGSFRILENGKITSEIRQFGFVTRIRTHLIDQIQTGEWHLSHRLPVREYKLQLQITSAHRELYHYPLLEKHYPPGMDDLKVGLGEEEIAVAEKNLFDLNKHVKWEQAHLELVLWFLVDGREWQEFQRDNAHNLRWEHVPRSDCAESRCEWILWNFDNPAECIPVLKSGIEKKIEWPQKVVLKPYDARRLVAWWDLDQPRIEHQIRTYWDTDLDQVGFYLKIHEEYLGDRIHRPDLEVQIHELFSSHQNVYFDVEPDKCFSVEIVARRYEMEMALTPVSNSIVTPRVRKNTGSPYPRTPFPKRWFHNSQREVRHFSGRDSSNIAKVLLHLHFHSPNLFRLDPFRESFLKDKTWPIKTMHGAEVHNPPGEWVMKNCLDSWLPLLRSFRKLASEETDFQISIDISPPVAFMLSSPRFKDYMSRYLQRMQAYAAGQLALMKSYRDREEYIRAAENYLADVKAIDVFYNFEINKDIIGAFRELESRGFVELSTCTVTHGMPAELSSMNDSLNSQVELAALIHQRLFNSRPNGIWLAENSFFPGIEAFLSKESLNFFFVESEAVLYGSSCPDEEEFNPVLIPASDVAAFPRSRLGRTQVWDADIGYAGHPEFREYHFRHMGLPLKRITSKKNDDKQPYRQENAEKTARELAWDFHHKLSETAHRLKEKPFQTIPLISCSYDAELFGHHWSEGPVFLKELLREFFRKGDAIGLTTPSHYLIDSNRLPEIMPNPSTWGHEAVHVKWSDPKVIWVYRELERADGILKDYLGMALRGELKEQQKIIVEQMGAELLRAQSSDLTFVIMSQDFEEDMVREILKYLDYFYKLKHLVDNGFEYQDFLLFRKHENNMFPEMPEYYRIR